MAGVTSGVSTNLVYRISIDSLVDQWVGKRMGWENLTQGR
jgi:hypothetical protein